jgi:centrin-1
MIHQYYLSVAFPFFLSPPTVRYLLLLFRKELETMVPLNRPLFMTMMLFVASIVVLEHWIGKNLDNNRRRDLAHTFQTTTTRIIKSDERAATVTTVEESFDDSILSEDSAEAAEDFVNVSVVVVIVLLLLLLTIFFEHSKEHLEETCRRDGKHMMEILEKLFGEMTVLGFLSLVTFVVTRSGTFRMISEAIYGDEGEELLEMFELVHFTLFFIMLLFVFQVFVLVKGAIQTEHMWVHMDRAIREQKRSQQDNNVNGAEHHPRNEGPAHHAPVGSSSDELALFEALRDEFILEREVNPPFQPAPESRRVSEDFAFGRYLGVSLGNLLTNAVEVKSATWLFFAAATILYYVICLTVEEDPIVLVWIWVGIAWAVFLFNIIFERHLTNLLRSFVKKSTLSTSRDDDESTQLLADAGQSSLPSWCQVDLQTYLQSRSWITRCIVGGVPNRQQALFWMDAKGPTFYLIILQINLVFSGLYTAIQLLEFVPIMYHSEPLWVFLLYLVMATLPLLGIMLNKQRLVATLSEVCCMGVYRRPQVVSTVMREEKTAHVVRAFIILYKLRRMTEHHEDRDAPPRRSSSGRTFGQLETEEISMTFDAFDQSGDGLVTYDELKQLLARLGTSMDSEGIQRVIKALDVDNDGAISKAEFLQWYAEVEGHEDEISEHERAEFLFSMFDENETGHVTIGEFKRKLDALHAGLSVDDVGAIVQELDHDNTGHVGPEEFEQLIVKYYPRELRE